jgi:hypothetical protein
VNDEGIAFYNRFDLLHVVSEASANILIYFLYDVGIVKFHLKLQWLLLLFFYERSLLRKVSNDKTTGHKNSSEG